MFQDAEWNLWEEADPVGTGLLEEDGLDDEPLPDGDDSEVVEDAGEEHDDAVGALGLRGDGRRRSSDDEDDVDEEFDDEEDDFGEEEDDLDEDFDDDFDEDDDDLDDDLDDDADDDDL
ncbi:MAG: hypothetical protein KA383_14460 [Phycisphaerae bacterium]|nr:hypothetical protein [Phycisphaerae bacterium]